MAKGAGSFGGGNDPSGTGYKTKMDARPIDPPARAEAVTRTGTSSVLKGGAAGGNISPNKQLRGTLNANDNSFGTKRYDVTSKSLTGRRMK